MSPPYDITAAGGTPGGTPANDTPTPHTLSPHDDDDESPPESRASPSFSFHEERRLLKSDEYWLAHKLPRLPPAAVPTSERDSEGLTAVADVEGEAAGLNSKVRSMEINDDVDAEEQDAEEEEGEEADGFPYPSRSTRSSTLFGCPSDLGLEADPVAAIHRYEHDRDERLNLEEEDRERLIAQHNPLSSVPHATAHEEEQFDTAQAFADSGVGSELEALYSAFSRCLALRDKYMELSNQRLGDNPRDRDGKFCGFKDGTCDVTGLKPDASPSAELPTNPNEPAWKMNPPPPPPHWKWTWSEGTTKPQHLGDQSEDAPPRRPSTVTKFNLKEVEIPGPEPEGQRHRFALNEEGVFLVYDEKVDTSSTTKPKPLSRVPRLREYYSDLDYLLNVCSDGPAKSFAFRRLKYLASKWNLYTLLNEYQELADMKAVPHRDFYNVRKVDTHIHHSASMNQKHLLRFIKSKLRKCPDEIVIHRDGKDLTLQEVFDSLNLTAYDLSIDTLDMHAHQEFHRFDRFNNRYNPTGSSRLREIFLKTDNLLKGTYLAELTKELIADLEQSKYQNSEWRVSIYGRNMNEWDKLAKWVVDNDLVSHNVRWLIQVPRLYEVFKAGGLVNNYEDVVKNVFQPLFEVTADPSTHPELHIFLQRVVGFDSVDDESKPERRLYRKFPTAQMWDTNQSPPYSYWIYYMYANMASLNAWRKARGFSTFVLRPHCGEAGDPEHLSSAFLTSHSISHGILLRKVPALQYLFYLKQIGLAMSPLSNNALFLTYDRNPFKDFFKIGMNVSLSTDDPLQFHFTAQHLLEEYSCAAQIYKLTPADMCELARNSVIQSGWEMTVKKHWIGYKWYIPGATGNDIHKTNVPNIRLAYRHATLLEELSLIKHGSSKPNPAMPLHHGGDTSKLGAASMHQTKATVFDHTTIAPGAAVLDNRSRRRNSIRTAQAGLSMTPALSMPKSPTKYKRPSVSYSPSSPTKGAGAAPTSPTNGTAPLK